MRLWFGGPRILGIRPGISLGAEDFNLFRDPAKKRPTSPTSASVYVISMAPNIHKIGMSIDPNIRRGQLQTGNGDRLNVVFYLPIPNGHAKNVETFAHKILDADHRGGDWFTVSEMRAVAAVVASAQYYGVTVEMTDASTGETLEAFAVERKPMISKRLRILGTLPVIYIAASISHMMVADPLSSAPIYCAIGAGLMWWFMTRSRA